MHHARRHSFAFCAFAGLVALAACTSDREHHAGPKPQSDFHVEIVGAGHRVDEGEVIDATLVPGMTAVVRDIDTAVVKNAHGHPQFMRYSVQITDGRGVIAKGSHEFQPHRGEFYIVSTFLPKKPKFESLPACCYLYLNAATMPMVIGDKVVRAGSVGTHWWIHRFEEAGNDIMHIVLLDAPKSDEPSGPIVIVDEVATTRACICGPGRYVTIVNGQLLESACGGEITPIMGQLIEKAKTRAYWAGLRAAP